MGAQVQVPLSLYACFLEAGGLPFEIIDLVGHFFYDCDQFLVGGGELSVFCNQLLKHRFLVDCGSGEVVKLSFKIFHDHLVDVVVCFHFACVVNPCGRICRTKLA